MSDIGLGSATGTGEQLDKIIKEYGKKNYFKSKEEMLDEYMNNKHLKLDEKELQFDAKTKPLEEILQRRVKHAVEV